MVRSVWSYMESPRPLPLCVKVFFDRLPKDRNIIDGGLPNSFDIHPLVVVDQNVAHTLGFGRKVGHRTKERWRQMPDGLPMI